MGGLFAILALISWGVGDFLIQKSTRKFGDWLSLFYITGSISIVLLPFIYQDLPALFNNSYNLLILICAGLVSTFAALCLFEGLREGKISIVEPIFALEIIVTAFLAQWFLQEKIALWQFSFIITLILGVALVSVKSLAHFKNFKLEAGVLIAVLATIGMGAENFLYGLGARLTNPLLVNWFASLIVALITLGFIIYKKQTPKILSELKARPGLIFWMSLLDNVSWIFYTFSIIYIPMALATGISEGYVALAILLGLWLNHEKIKFHQIIGLVLTLLSAVVLLVSLNF